MKFDIQPNRNGRYYSPEVLKKAVEDAQPRIKARQMLGEIDPPGDARTRMRDVSHVVTALRVDDNGCLIGDLEILDTPAGKMLRDLMTAGAPMHVTTRGLGSVSGNKVGKDFKLLGISMSPGVPPWESVVDKLGRLTDEPEENEDE